MLTTRRAWVGQGSFNPSLELTVRIDTVMRISRGLKGLKLAEMTLFFFFDASELTTCESGQSGQSGVTLLGHKSHRPMFPLPSGWFSFAPT